MKKLGFGICAIFLLAGCPENGGDDDDDQVPVLDPEPAGAPTAVATGSYTCIGQEPPAAAGTTLTLPGWVRSYADPTNSMDMQPAAEVEAFDENGTSLGSAFSDTATGRVALTVPIRPTGFIGSATVTAAGYLDLRFTSSRPAVNTDAAAWTWLVTPDELTTLAATAGVAIDAAKGIVTGSVHDCDVFGVENAVIRVGGEGGTTTGVIFLDGFDPAPTRTFSGASGRFVIPNVTPGQQVSVAAFGRRQAGGKLELLSQAYVQVDAGKITAVDLEPRVGTAQ